MTSNGYSAALVIVLRWEGGLVENPRDPGGRTNHGVTQREYDSWRQRSDLPFDDVANISQEELYAIYWDDYWMPSHSADIPQRLDLVQFDAAIMSGPKRAIRFLQQSSGCEIDGVFGPRTAASIDSCDPTELMRAFCNLRAAYYNWLVAKDPALREFLGGWLNRLDKLERIIGLSAESAAGNDLTFSGMRNVPIRRIPDFGVDASFDNFPDTK